MKFLLFEHFGGQFGLPAFFIVVSKQESCIFGMAKESS